MLKCDLTPSGQARSFLACTRFQRSTVAVRKSWPIWQSGRPSKAILSMPGSKFPSAPGLVSGTDLVFPKESGTQQDAGLTIFGFS